MSHQKNIHPVQKHPQSRNNHHALDLRNEFLTPNKKSEHFDLENAIKQKANRIKINKTKLPVDFFPKTWSLDKNALNLRLDINQQQRVIISDQSHRVQSERLHHSPQRERTSFFGFFQQQSTKIPQFSSKKLALKRKFQTRESPKRDNSDMKRRFTPGSNLHRQAPLQFYPSQYDQHLTELVTSSSITKIERISPRKEYQRKYQQQVHDPEKDLMQVSKNISRKNSSNIINLKTIQTTNDCEKIAKEESSYVFTETLDLHNMTFFNAKSSSLPPIKKQLIYEQQV